jgi:hypothetical protein
MYVILDYFFCWVLRGYFPFGVLVPGDFFEFFGNVDNLLMVRRIYCFGYWGWETGGNLVVLDCIANRSFFWTSGNVLHSFYFWG